MPTSSGQPGSIAGFPLTRVILSRSGRFRAMARSSRRRPNCRRASAMPSSIADNSFDSSCSATTSGIIRRTRGCRRTALVARRFAPRSARRDPWSVESNRMISTLCIACARAPVSMAIVGKWLPCRHPPVPPRAPGLLQLSRSLPLIEQRPEKSGCQVSPDDRRAARFPRP